MSITRIFAKQTPADRWGTFVDRAYRLALGREPTAAERNDLCGRIDKGALTCADALEALDAARSKPNRIWQAWVEPELSASARELSAALERCDRLPRARYDVLYRERFESGRALIIGQDAYGPQHKERFWELFNACDRLLADRASPRILEFGTSEFSAFYQSFFPHATVHLSDRPVAEGYIGFDEQVARRLGCADYHSIDLEQGRATIEASLPERHFDLICFTEVIEHLDANPVELIGALLGRLKVDGSLYLTTPNFFRSENLERIAAWENPQELYPETGDNWDAHHHHREYAAKELIRFVTDAGGQVAAFYFSACWDAPEPRPIHERSNIVLIARPVNRSHRSCQ